MSCEQYIYNACSLESIIFLQNELLKRMNHLMYKRLRTVILLSSFFLPVIATCQIKNVWALGDGEKVFRDDLNHPSKRGNLAWDGKAIHLTGLFNEVLAF